MNLLMRMPFNEYLLSAKRTVQLKSIFSLINTKVFGMILFIFMSSQVKANELKFEPKLTIAPEQCVALLQGQACYVTVELNWQTAVLGDYCLYSSLNSRALECWRDKKMGELKQEFVSKANIEFFLRAQSSKENIATIEIKMAWVHKKKGKPRKSWRMF